MHLSMQPKTASPQKYTTLLRSSEYQPTTVKKAHPLNTQSPYTHSPQKMNYSIVSQDEAELYRGKCLELEREVTQYRSNVELQRLLQSKSTDLESKVVEVVEQNNSLQAQLDRAQKSALQRKSESEMWKSKYEAQMGQIMQIKGNYEQEIRALSQEIQKVNAKITSVEQDKNRTISDQRYVADSQTQQVQEQFKRSNSLQSEMYEQQILKLRDMLEDKSLQVAQLQTSIERQRVEANDTQMRLLSDVEQMKARVSSIQIDHQAELQALKSKLELYKDTHLRNAQFAHENQTDIMQTEINKLKHLLDIKNEEIETLVNQNQKQKMQYDLEAAGLREDIEIMKKQLLNNEQVHQQENHHIQTNLETLHNQETTNIKISHENQIQTLHREVIKLKEIIDCKNIEIEKQIIEKQQQKDYYDGEIHRLINTIEDWKRKSALIEAEKNREISDLHARIERLMQQHEAIQLDLNKQIQLLIEELNNLKALIDHKNHEITSNLNQFSQVKLDLEERIRVVQKELEITKLRAFEVEKQKVQEIGDLRLVIKELEQNYREKVKSLEQVIDHQKYEIGKNVEMFNNKSRECENMMIQRNNSDQMARRLQDDNDRLVEKLQKHESEKNLEVDELRQKMDSGAAYQFENLKSAYNTQVGILSDQITDLQNQLSYKNKELTEMVEKYAILDKTMLPDSLVRGNTYNSRVGVPAEFIANKAIHDMSMRSQMRNSSIQRY